MQCRQLVVFLMAHCIRSQESQNVVLTLYRLWLLLVVTLIVNMVACIFLLIGDVSGGG